MNEFRINEYFSVSYSYSYTYIIVYVNGVDIDVVHFNPFTSAYDPNIIFEKWCSTLKTWYEHDCDTNLIVDKRKAFKLLKALIDAGDPLARKVFKDEIAKWFETGDPNLVRNLMEEGSLQYLRSNELELLIGMILNTIKDIKDIRYKINAFQSLFEALKNAGLLSKLAPQIEALTIDIISTIKDLENNEKKIQFFGIFLRVIKDIKQLSKFTSQLEEMFESNFKVLLNMIKDMDNRKKADAFLSLLGRIEGTKVIDHNFTVLLNILKDIEDPKWKLACSNHFFVKIKDIELWSKYIPQLETFTNSLVKIVKEMKNISDKLDSFRALVSAIKGTELFEDHFQTLLNIVKSMENSIHKVYAFIYLLEGVKEGGPWSKYAAEIETLTEDFMFIVRCIKDNEDPRFHFKNLINGIQGTKLFEDHFILLLNMVGDMRPHDDKIYAFSYLIGGVKEGGLWNKFAPQMESLFLNILHGVNYMELNDDTGEAFRSLLKAIKNTKLLENNLMVLILTIKNMKNIQEKFSLFLSLVKIIKEAELLSKCTSQIEDLTSYLIQIVKNNDYDCDWDEVDDESVYDLLFGAVKDAGLWNKFAPQMESIKKEIDDMRSSRPYS
jgi:hypothetical protein